MSKELQEVGKVCVCEVGGFKSWCRNLHQKFVKGDACLWSLFQNFTNIISDGHNKRKGRTWTLHNMRGLFDGVVFEKCGSDIRYVYVPESLLISRNSLTRF